MIAIEERHKTTLHFIDEIFNTAERKYTAEVLLTHEGISCHI